MSQAGSEEKLRIVDVASLLGDGVVPICLDRDAVEDDEENSKDEPDDGDAKHQLDRDSDGRELEDAPVKGEDGDLGCGDGEGVCKRNAVLHEAGMEKDVLYTFFAHVQWEQLSQVPIRCP